MQQITVSFKETIYKMFLKGAIVPAFFIAIVGVLFTFGLWGYTTISMTLKSNERVCREMELVMQSYETELQRLSEQSELVLEPLDKSATAEVFESIYSLSNQLGYSVKLCIFNSEYESVLSNTQTIPQDLWGNANWGIFRQMQQEPEEMAMKVVREAEGQSSDIYMGKSIEDHGDTVGYVVFVIDSSQFLELLMKVPAQSVITDSFGWVYLANNYDFCDNLNRMSRQYDQKNGFISCDGKEFYMKTTKMMDGQLCIHSVLEVSNQLAAFKWVVLLILFLFGMILFFLTRGAERISRQSTKDIDAITDAFEQVKQGNLDYYISICSSSEFQTIGESYNLMLDSLKDQIAKNREMIAHMAFAQIKQLESQMNPHFLFNTLENIRIMCKIDPAKADKMIVNLSSLLRYSISNEEEVTVRADMENTNHYLSILKIRFNQRFQYVLEIEEEILEQKIPKLLIQPLIENAIKYGFGDQETLRVEVTGFQEAGDLVFVCKDDGVGIEEETLCELKHTLRQPKNRSSHLGLYNIHKRIQLKYKGDYGITVESKVGQGTIIRLRVPGTK